MGGDVKPLASVPDPDLEIRGGGGGGRCPKKIFRPFGPQYGIKIRGAGPPGPSPGSATGLFVSLLLFFVSQNRSGR